MKTPRASRFEIRVPLLFRRPGESGWHSGTTENISASGILFTTDVQLEPHSPVEMRFTLPLEVAGRPGGVVAGRGRIVRDVPAGGDAGPLLAATIARYRIVRQPRPWVVKEERWP